MGSLKRPQVDAVIGCGDTDMFMMLVSKKMQRCQGIGTKAWCRLKMKTTKGLNNNGNV